MPAIATNARRRIPMTQFHNAMGEFLDQAMRTPIILTSHGRDKQIVADLAYVERLEAMDRGNRSEESRVGKECLERCRSRWAPYH